MGALWVWVRIFYNLRFLSILTTIPSVLFVNEPFKVISCYVIERTILHVYIVIDSFLMILYFKILFYVPISYHNEGIVYHFVIVDFADST